MSSAGYVGKATNWHGDIDGTSQNEERLSQYGEIPGQIVAFDAQKQTATVRPLYKPKFNGQVLDMPDLEDVPVRFARGGDGAITFPVKAGDRVVLRPQMRSSELYHSEDNGEASDARSFNLSDMEAHLDGGESLQDPIQNFDGANTHVRFDPKGQYGIRGSADGKVKIEGAEGNIYELTVESLELLAQGFVLLGTETDLIHRAQYAEIGEELTERAEKLRGMVL